MKISSIVKRLRPLAKKYNISYVILFGSLAEKRFVKKESDIDIAIKVKGLKKKEASKLLKNFIKDLDVENVDVVIINFSPFSLLFDILTKGKVLYCENEDEILEDRLKIFKLHDDWLYFSKIFEKREMEKVMR